MKKFFISILLIIAMSAPVWAADVDTLIITNEGMLIDNMIADGYGTSTLVQVATYLQGVFGTTAIPASFLTALTAAGGEAGTTTLSAYASATTAVAIGADGSVFTVDMSGDDYFGHTGYSTQYSTTDQALQSTEEMLTDGQQKLCTYASGSDYYITAGAIGDNTYKAFAIAYSNPYLYKTSGKPGGVVSSLVLTNGGGADYLIDNLVDAGYTTLYQAAVALQPQSNGAITDLFIATMTVQPATSEIFTTTLSTFTGTNNPVGINADGTFIYCDVDIADYYGETGYTTNNVYQSNVGYETFTAADDNDYNIYLGQTNKNISYYGIASKTYYYAFAIAWSMPTTLVLSNEGGLIDELVAAGYGDYSLYDTLVALQPSSGGTITDGFLATLMNCDADSEVFTATLSTFTDDTNNPIGINSDGSLMVVDIFGTDYYGETGYKTCKADQAGIGRIRSTSAESSDYFIDTGVDSNGITYQAVGIIWSK